VASPSEAPGANGVASTSIARVNDVWLDGVHHDHTDSAYADSISLCAPHIPYLVRASRALTGRIVRYLIDKGVRQFLDLGSGIPTVGHVHEVAQAADPRSRVVYVDIDTSVAAVGRKVLAGEDGVDFLQADIRHVESVLDAPELRRLIDLDEPVGLLVIETLLYLPDADDPAGVLRSYIDALCPGSYVGLSHCSENAELRAGLDLFSRMFGDPPAVTLRDREQLMAYFAGLELVHPGIVPVPLWNPLTEDEVGQNPELAHMHTGLARKP
jgi:SAM-dependent methyltransferase